MNRSKQMAVALTALAFVTLMFSSLVITDTSDAATGSVLELTSTPTGEQIAAIAGGEYAEVVFSSGFTMGSLLSIPDGTKITAGLVNGETKQGYVVLAIEDINGNIGVLGSYTTLASAKTAFDDYRTTNNNLSLTITLAENSYTCCTQSHIAFVCGELNVKGNNSTLVNTISSKSGQLDFSIENAEFPSEVTMKFADIKNFEIWGQRISDTNFDISIINCDSSTEDITNATFVMLRGGTYEATAKTVLYIEGCSIDGSKLTAEDSTAIHVTTATDVTISDCSFSNVKVPVNFNFKSTGYESSVKISDCAFTDCGTSTVTSGLDTYSAPIRIVDSGAHDGNTSVVVAACSFDYSEGHSSVNGDVLIGDGRSGKNSNSIDLSIYRTDADIQVQKPGYYNANTFQVGDEDLRTSHASTVTEAMVVQGDVVQSTFVPTVTIFVGNTIVMTIPENGTIYYTLDGSAPTLNGSVYTGPISVTGSWTVKAMYISDNGFISQVSTAVTNYSPGSDVDDDDDYPFIPGNNTPQTSSNNDKTTLVAAAAAVVVIMLAVVALMVTRNH